MGIKHFFFKTITENLFGLKDQGRDAVVKKNLVLPETNDKYRKKFVKDN